MSQLSPWLPEILPEDWDVVQMRRFATFRNGADYKDVEVAEGGYPVYGSGGEFRRASDYLYEGDSVLFGRKGTINRPLLVSGRFWTVDTMFFTELGADIEPRFLHYYATTMPFDYYSTNTALPSMTQGDLGGHRMPLPPLPEQRAIADYLDRETARIDALIEEIETSIALSGERRSALITAAVTGQIDATLPAAGEVGRQHHDSDAGSGGVSFSSDGQRRSRLRYCLKVDPPVDPSVCENPDLEVSFLPMEAIGENGGLDLTREIPAQEASSGYTFVADGDVVLAKVTPCFENGKGALVFGLRNGFGFATTEVYALRPHPGVNASFLDYVLRSSDFRQYGTARLTGAGGLKRLSRTDLKNFEIMLPSPVEQRAIADYLDRETAKIDTLITDQRQLIELARERRSALITAAVTGQIDVRKGH